MDKKQLIAAWLSNPLNKRQIIVSCLMGIAFAAFYVYAVFMVSLPKQALRFMLSSSTPILIFSGLLIYGLRDKKKG